MKKEPKTNQEWLKLVKENYDIARVEYQKPFARARKLAATDDGSLWTIINAQFPEYQITPDTNDVSYVKSNILSSVYTVGKSARLLPTSEHDKDIVENINIMLEHIWDICGVKEIQMQAGERAALMNLGITQVGWDNNMVTGTGSTFRKGEIALKNIDPLKFMRDPFSTSLETAAYCMTWDTYHASVIKGNSKYKEAFEKYLAQNPGYGITNDLPQTVMDNTSGEGAYKKDYYTVFTHFVFEDGKVHEIHTVENKFILFVKEDIKPSVFPFAELYCNLPAGKLFGISEPAKIFQSSVSYNMMLSLGLTAEYKNQRPPKFISDSSGLNVATFSRTGNDADQTFVVRGDASKAVSYHEFPNLSPMVPQLLANIKDDMQRVSGVDGRYTGRDTGSILTTGGMTSMLDQVTMIDSVKVLNYETYCKNLTKLIIANYINNSAMERSYMIQDKSTGDITNVTVDFPKIDNDTVFDYAISISSELPKNKARIEESANKLMEMQMQYKGAGIDVDLIQPEEWLSAQDIPMREFMLKRMKIQRTSNYESIVAGVVDKYTKLIDVGVDPEQALKETAGMMQTEQTPGMEKQAEEQMVQLEQAKNMQQDQQLGALLGNI